MILPIAKWPNFLKLKLKCCLNEKKLKMIIMTLISSLICLNSSQILELGGSLSLGIKDDSNSSIQNAMPLII